MSFIGKCSIFGVNWGFGGLCCHFSMECFKTVKHFETLAIEIH